MKVNDPNLAALASAGAAKTQETAAPAARRGQTSGPASAAGDDVHLSELVRSLRSLAAESPERQARIEQIARSYASGNYQTDQQGTASKLIDDALEG